MKRMLLAAAAVASLVATSALAADLPVKAPPPVLAPVWNWTGFYIGANGGYGWGGANTAIAPFASVFPTVALGSFSQNVDGGLGGGQIGYNWQVDPKWLIGLEADIQGTGERSSANLTTISARYGSNSIGIPVARGPDFNSITTLTTALSYDLQWFATFRGRVGLLATPQTLLYATGGLAVGEFKYSAATNLGIQVFGPGLAGLTPRGTLVLPIGPAASDSDTRAGWTVGVGIEHKFTPNWSGKLEYLYMDFGTKTYFAGTANQADVSFHDQIFRAGINYDFAATPVAKY